MVIASHLFSFLGKNQVDKSTLQYADALCRVFNENMRAKLIWRIAGWRILLPFLALLPGSE